MCVSAVCVKVTGLLIRPPELDAVFNMSPGVVWLVSSETGV